MGKIKKGGKNRREYSERTSNENPKFRNGNVEKRKTKQKEASIVPGATSDKIRLTIKKKSNKRKSKGNGEGTEPVKTKQDTSKEDEDEPTVAPNVPEKAIRHDSKLENTIFIGNVPSNTKKRQLQVLFGQFGKVVSVRLRTSNGKKLFKHETRKKADTLNAYVVFDNIESARKAMELTGTDFKGKHIRVTAAKNFTEEIEPKRTLFVGNLKYSATDENLYDIFATCGELDYVRTIRNEKGCSGVSYVCFKKPESVTLALELNNTMLDERPIRVQRYVKNKVGAHSVNSTPASTKKLTGSARRVMEKNKLKNPKVQRQGQKFNNKGDTKPAPPSKGKKSDYRGVKTASKKKLKNKKKSSHSQNLARKIAPK